MGELLEMLLHPLAWVDSFWRFFSVVFLLASPFCLYKGCRVSEMDRARARAELTRRGPGHVLVEGKVKPQRRGPPPLVQEGLKGRAIVVERQPAGSPRAHFPGRAIPEMVPFRLLAEGATYLVRGRLVRFDGGHQGGWFRMEPYGYVPAQRLRVRGLFVGERAWVIGRRHAGPDGPALLGELSVIAEKQDDLRALFRLLGVATLGLGLLLVAIWIVRDA
jgi:hypothetical protein